MFDNKVKNKLNEGKAVIGTFVKINDPVTIEMLGYAGFDFVIIDNEHTSMGKESVVNLIRTAELAGVLPTVRIRGNNPDKIKQALDAGAMGIQIPTIETKEEALAVVKAAKFAPLGNRGYAASVRACKYGFMDPVEFAQKSNEDTMVIVYCETDKGINNLDNILTVDEIDIVFIGPADISQSIGLIGQMKHEEVQNRITTIIEKVKAAGKVVGTVAADAEQAKYWIDRGVQYVTIGSDNALIGYIGKKFINELKESGYK